MTTPTTPLTNTKFYSASCSFPCAVMLQNTDGELTLRRFRHGWVETIHVVAPVTVVTEQELVLEQHVTFQHSVHATLRREDEAGELTSFSEVPHMLQHLHSMHCQRYVFTAAIMTGVNCRQEGWPVWAANTFKHCSCFSCVSQEMLHLSVQRTWAAAVGAGHQLFRLASLVIGFGISQAEVAVIIRQRKTIWASLWSWRQDEKKKKNPESISAQLHSAVRTCSTTACPLLLLGSSGSGRAGSLISISSFSSPSSSARWEWA